MGPIARLFAGLAMLAAMLLSPATGWAALADLPIDDGLPVRVTPHVLVDRIIEVNVKDNTFTSEISLGLQWKDSRLAFDTTTTGLDQREYLNEAARAQLAKMWQPRIGLLNQSEPPKILSSVLIIRADGSIRLTERLLSKARIEWHLEDYPFDHQTLLWQLGSTDYSRESVALRTGTVVVPPNLLIKNWASEHSSQVMSETAGMTGRIIAGLSVGLVVKRQSSVVITQVFMPYFAIMLLPMIVLFTVGPNTPTHLFTALLALLTLNFKIVLEEPAVVAVQNSMGDALWMGYCYIGLTLVLALSVMRAVPDTQLSDVMISLRSYLKWWAALTFLALVGGRILAAA